MFTVCVTSFEVTFGTKGGPNRGRFVYMYMALYDVRSSPLAVAVTHQSRLWWVCTLCHTDCSEHCSGNNRSVCDISQY